MRHLNPKKTVRTPELIASVAAAIEEDHPLSMEAIAAAHGVSEKTIFNILHQDLGLEKKLARWVPKLLSEEQKQERLRVCSDFIAAVHRRSKAMLDAMSPWTKPWSPITRLKQKTEQTVDPKGSA
jgi:hypothetical protein